MTVRLGTMPEWQFTDKQLLTPAQAAQGTGYYAHFLADGELWFYKDTDRSRTTGLKTVFKDPAGLIPYPNPTKLDGVGAIGLIYFQEDEPYYIELRQPSSPSQPLGDIVRVWEHYTPPGTGTPPPVTTFVDFENFIINAQFDSTYIQRHFDLTSTLKINIAPDVKFQKSNTSGTDSIEILDLPVGTELEGRPKRFVRYEATSAGSGETFKDFIFEIGTVESFVNQPISFAFQGQSATTSPVDVYIVQHFGTGGGAPSADVETNIGTKNLLVTFSKYEISGVTPPGIGGKTLGTNGDDRFEIHIRMPLNVPSAIVDLTNDQLNEGNSALSFAAFPAKKSYVQDRSLQLPKISTLNPFESKFDMVSFLNLSTGLYNLRPENPVGTILQLFGETIPDGYLPLHGSYAITTIYKRLFDYWAGAMFGIEDSSCTATVATNVVTITNSSNGAVTAISDVDTGFAFAVTQTGTALLPQISTVTTNAASTLSNGDSFEYTTVAKVGLLSDYTPYFRINYEDKPPLTSRTLVPIDITGTETANELAIIIKNAMNPIAYYLPDARALFFRAWNNGRTDDFKDPDAATRLDRGDGTTGDAVGTTQADEFEEHTHPIWANDAKTSGAFDEDGRPTYTVKTTTDPRGGAESRGKNIYVLVCIKF